MIRRRLLYSIIRLNINLKIFFISFILIEIVIVTMNFRYEVPKCEKTKLKYAKAKYFFAKAKYFFAKACVC